jgi:16S rRNA (guanine(966)-N(2))-methyltransferase RsmD
MRITSGKYKGREIHAPPGKTTRPALSRVRQAIFNTIGGAIEGARVLDLFAGSGGFVIEALSRGAASAVAIDLDRAAVRAIRENLARCRVVEPVEVYKNDAFDAIEKLAARGARFDVVAIAPPYWKGLQARALEAIERASLLARGGLLFVQRDEKEPASPEETGALVRGRVKEYGNTIVEWYERRASFARGD